MAARRLACANARDDDARLKFEAQVDYTRAVTAPPWHLRGAECLASDRADQSPSRRPARGSGTCMAKMRNPQSLSLILRKTLNTALGSRHVSRGASTFDGQEG